MQTEIAAFFENYKKAFNQLDGEAVADLYAVPSGIASDAGYTHWPMRESIAKNMVTLCGQYWKKGFVAADFQVVAFLAQGENFAIADLSWTILWTDGQDDWHFNTTYNLLRTPVGWRILLCTAYSETRLPASADT